MNQRCNFSHHCPGGRSEIRTQGTEQNGLFNLFSVCYGGGLFTIGGGNGIWESVDGSNWIRKLSTEGGILDGIAYGVGHRIAVGSSALYARDTGSGRWLPIAGMP